jgi:hypothetical protein
LRTSKIRIGYNKNMASTSRGIVYPTSGDNIAPLETHFASLANSVDEAIVDAVGVVPQSGSNTFTGPTSTTTPVDVTVTLPVDYFSEPPVVVASVAGSSTASAYFAVIHSITAVQFRARVWRTTGTTAESLTLQWIAK